MAVGARQQDVLKLVLGNALGLALTGIPIGFAGALMASRSLATLLFGLKPTDLLTLTAVSILIGAAIVLASLIPARRASSIDPMAALRYE